MDLGRIFHFVLAEGKSKGQCRPFMVVREWSPGMANGLVFLDGSNDFVNDAGQALKEPSAAGQPWPASATVAWVTSAGRSKGGTERTWHRWEDCASNRPEEQTKGPAFINAVVDLKNGNPDVTHVIKIPELEIPWPAGLTLKQALEAWKRC